MIRKWWGTKASLQYLYKILSLHYLQITAALIVCGFLHNTKSISLYPDRYTFWEKDGRQFVSDVLYEQKEGSPHQYIRSAGDIRNDSVIVYNHTLYSSAQKAQ